jgi:hypothetical protein
MTRIRSDVLSGWGHAARRATEPPDPPEEVREHVLELTRISPMSRSRTIVHAAWPNRS